MDQSDQPALLSTDQEAKNADRRKTQSLCHGAPRRFLDQDCPDPKLERQRLRLSGVPNPLQFPDLLLIIGCLDLNECELSDVDDRKITWR